MEGELKDRQEFKVLAASFGAMLGIVIAFLLYIALRKMIG